MRADRSSFLVVDDGKVDDKPKKARKQRVPGALCQAFVRVSSNVGVVLGHAGPGQSSGVAREMEHYFVHWKCRAQDCKDCVEGGRGEFAFSVFSGTHPLPWCVSSPTGHRAAFSKSAGNLDSLVGRAEGLTTSLRQHRKRSPPLFEVCAPHPYADTDKCPVCSLFPPPQRRAKRKRKSPEPGSANVGVPVGIPGMGGPLPTVIPTVIATSPAVTAPMLVVVPTIPSQVHAQLQAIHS